MQNFRQQSLFNLPTPMNISIWWNGGSILGVLLGFQILTGLFLSMHYTADLENTFNSVIHIMRDTPWGWMMRNFHANGASLFFIFMYLHIGRGLYYQSYITQVYTWVVGVTIFFISMGTAFLGYVLPWGQMSFWGATVITNLLSAIPYLGSFIVEWVWGGFSVGQPTLNRFFSLHFLLPFVILGLSGLHIFFLHEKGSSNPLGSLNQINKVYFHPYFSWKDLVGFIFLLMMIVLLGIFYPTLLGDPDNFILANPMVTPVHIQPEWYFLFAYAILRSIPSKLGGVIALVMSIAILYFLPYSSLYLKSSSCFNPLYQFCFWVLFIFFILLTWLGACPIEDPYMGLALPLTFLYFGGFIALMYSSYLWYDFVSEY